MRILGISAFYHDSAAALVEDGHIIAAAQEERFTRKKQDARYPENAIRYCLEEGGLTPDELDYIVFYEKPFVKFERLLETYLAFALILICASRCGARCRRRPRRLAHCARLIQGIGHPA